LEIAKLNEIMRRKIEEKSTIDDSKGTYFKLKSKPTLVSDKQLESFQKICQQNEKSQVELKRFEQMLQNTNRYLVYAGSFKW